MQVPITILFPVQNIQYIRHRRYAHVFETDFVSELRSSLFVSLDQVSNSHDVELNTWSYTSHTPHTSHISHTLSTTPLYVSSVSL